MTRRRLPGEPTAVARITRVARRVAERSTLDGATEEAVIDHIRRHAAASAVIADADAGDRLGAIAHLTAAAGACVALAARLDEEGRA